MEIEIVNVKREFAKGVIESLKGRFFSVIFEGKHDKAVHKINGRIGVVSHSRGSKPGNNLGSDLMVAFNVHKMDYRTINLDGIMEIRCDKKIYKFS